MELLKDIDELHARTHAVFPVRLDLPIVSERDPVWIEMLDYAEEQFGPEAVTEVRGGCGFAFDAAARWTWNWTRTASVYFKSLADATLFKLRWD